MMLRDRLSSRFLTSAPAVFARLLAVGALLLTPAATAQSTELLDKLNEPWRRLSETSRSSTRLFTAYLDMTAPPAEVGPDFNHTTIWPGMENWDAVKGWAAENSNMGKALLEVQSCEVLGVPYGTDGVDPRFVERGLVALIAPDGDLTRTKFPYLKAIETISAYASAEMYRLCEEGKFDEAFKVGVANLRVLRQACDAQMYDEKFAAMTLLAEAMSVHRDVIYSYRSKLSLDVLRQLSMKEYPFLKPRDDQRLKRIAMPEGDLWLAIDLLGSVFDDSGQVDGEKFSKTFSDMQARSAPMTGFGAVKRWERVAGVHGSLEASTVKLNAIYDDWWRRWRMRGYDPLMSLPTELSVVNPVKYAAVVFAARDIEELFVLRRRLVAEFCGLVVGSGITAYRAQFEDWPRAVKMAYTQFFPKRFDFDPYDRGYGSMEYVYLGSRTRGIETATDRVEVSGCLLFARNGDNTLNDATQHLEAGQSGDFVLWPPIRAVLRGQGE